MVTNLRKLIIFITTGIIVVLLALFVAYNNGYKTATLICENEKNDLIIKNEAEKKEIIAKIRQKSPVERRKELSRYVIY